MDIIQQTQALVNSKLDEALFYHGLGFNVLPIAEGWKTPDTAKLPLVYDDETGVPKPSWKQWQTERQTEGEVLAINWNAGIAGVNGINDIACFDFDHYDSIGAALMAVYNAGLPNDYKWIVKTGGGYHVWFKVSGTVAINGVDGTSFDGPPLDKAQLTKNPLSHIELRLSKHYTILPPTIHPVRQTPYEWLRGKPDEDMVTLTPEQVVNGYSMVTDLSKYGAKSLVEKREMSGVPNETWGLAALNSELDILRSTTEGGRNNQFWKSTCNIGGIIGGGSVDEEEAVEALMVAAKEIGLDEGEIYSTGLRGIAKGKESPRTPLMQASPTSVEAAKEDKELLDFAADDRGNAEAVQHLYGRMLYYTDAYGWLVWNGQHYERNAAKVNRMVEDAISRRHIAAYVYKNQDIGRVTKCNISVINNCVDSLRYKLTADVKDFDNDPHMLNCANGVVDLRTGELHPHTSAQMFTYVIPLDYDPNVDESLWKDTLRGTVGGGQEVIDYLQRAIGYSFTGHTNEESLFYLFGPTRSGKGTFTETILNLLPHPLATEVDFNTFTAKREGDNQNFDLAPLKPARLVFASESNKYQSLNPAKIKALTGGNMVWCAFKHRDMFSYKPQYTVWLSSNHPVNGDVDDSALWGRLKVIEFPNSYLGKEDKTLKERLRTPEQLQGVLKWVVEGAVKWYAEGGLTTPEAVKVATKKHRDELDTVAEWLEECTTKDGWASNEAVMRSYKEWCYQNSIEPKSVKYLSMSLKAKGYTPGVQKKDNGVNKKGVSGLKIH